MLTDNFVEDHHTLENLESSLPNQIKLTDTNETMKCRKVKAVIRYHTPNKRKEPEKFFHYLLMLYYPLRDESKLLHSDGTYASKYYQPDIQPIVDHNRSLFELDTEAVTEALENLRNNHNIINSYDSMNDEENDDIHNEVKDDLNLEELFSEQTPSQLFSSDSHQHGRSGTAGYTQPTAISDDESKKYLFSSQEVQEQEKII